VGTVRANRRGVMLVEKQDWFGRLIALGVSNSEACRIVGINRRTGTRWRYGRTILNNAGESVHYPPVRLTAPKAPHPRYLSLTERTTIADLHRAGAGLIDDRGPATQQAPWIRFGSDVDRGTLAFHCRGWHLAVRPLWDRGAVAVCDVCGGPSHLRPQRNRKRYPSVRRYHTDLERQSRDSGHEGVHRADAGQGTGALPSSEVRVPGSWSESGACGIFGLDSDANR
jgi:hypothetical protein